MAERTRRWPAALGGVAAGAAGLAVVLGGIGLVESSLTGGQTREWCEGTPGYDSPMGGELERCVRVRDNHNLVAADVRSIEFYRGGVEQRWEAHEWPLDGTDAVVEFTDDGVSVSDPDAPQIRATYPNSVYDDSR